ncbi:MAG TPA: hypothetical protein PK256_21120, partial [Verrucomicrobiota bacterium]|nr:hypothetical protein [Verrucomicrobiota bacterium]
MKTAGLIFWICLLGLVVIILSFTSYHATDSTEVGVRTIKWLGKRGVENQVYQPGAAYFFLPVINDWSTFDTKLQVLEMHGPQQMTIKTRDG